MRRLGMARRKERGRGKQRLHDTNSIGVGSTGFFHGSRHFDGGESGSSMAKLESKIALIHYDREGTGMF